MDKLKEEADTFMFLDKLVVPIQSIQPPDGINGKQKFLQNILYLWS